MRTQRGFTVLELIVAVVFLVAIGTVFLVQKRDLQIAERDSDRKTAINAIYYNLEDIYYAGNQSYPQSLTADQLKGLDPTMLKDPEGVAVGNSKSDYHYTAKDCKDGKCKSYELRAELEKEADFIKKSRNK